jgi:nucleoid DNA-binding protein
MNKVAIVEAVHAKLGGTKVQAEEVVDTVIDSIVHRSRHLLNQGSRRKTSKESSNR